MERSDRGVVYGKCYTDNNVLSVSLPFSFPFGFIAEQNTRKTIQRAYIYNLLAAPDRQHSNGPRIVIKLIKIVVIERKPSKP